MIAVTGANGRLGHALVELGCTPINCDVRSKKSIDAELIRLGITKHDTIIHCAAITDVDACEQELYKEAMRVNVYGTQNLREAFDGRIIYISTDYIFDGKKGCYKEDDEPNPINHYGYTKLLGEEVIIEYGFPHDIIVRTTLLYGSIKKDFVSQVIAKLKSGKSFPIPSNLYGSPTNVYHLAESLIFLCEQNFRKRFKIINIAGSGIISRYEFAKMIADILGYEKSLIYPSDKPVGIARRPSRAGLDVSFARSLRIPIYSVLDGIKGIKNVYSRKN